MDYNIYYDGTVNPKMGGQKVEPNCKIADPLFVNAFSLTNITTDAFKLKASSPAINSGTAVKAPSWDFAGTGRPILEKHDIGAFEYLLVTSTNLEDWNHSNSFSELPSDQNLKVFFNPEQNLLQIIFLATLQGDAPVVLQTLTGIKYLEKIVSVEEGVNRFELDVSRLEPGIYVLYLINGSGIETNRVIIDK